MEPGVPFALLGAVQILVVVAGVGLAVAGWLRRTGPGTLVALGASVLVVVEVRTALRLGYAVSDDLALMRAAAMLLLAAGLYSGGLGPRRTPVVMAGVVVPLAAAPGPSAFAGAAAVAAAAAVVANRRDVVGWWMGLGLGLWGAAAFVMYAALISTSKCIAWKGLPVSSASSHASSSACSRAFPAQSPRCRT